MTGSVFRSGDDGLTWSRAPASLPQGVVAVAAADPLNPSVTVVDNACAADKTDCRFSQASETTADGGQSWTTVSP